MRQFKVVYKHGQDLLAIDKQEHHSDLEPKETQVRDTLKRLCQDRNLRMAGAKAFVYELIGRTETLVATYLTIQRRNLQPQG